MSIAISAESAEQIRARERGLLVLAFAILLLMAFALALAPAARADSWSALGERWMHVAILPVWAACAWVLHRQSSRSLPARDPYLLPLLWLLTGWGLFTVWRLSPDFGLRQTGWLIVATAAALAVLHGPSDLRWLRRYRYLWLTAAIALAALTLLFGTNPSGGEAQLWLGCCGVYLQPSEPLRLLLIAFLASFLADRMMLDRRPGLRAFLPSLLPLLVMWGFAIALLAVQRDLGTGTLFLALLALLLYLALGRWQVLAVSAGFTVAAGALAGLLFPVVRARLEAWINPWADPIGRSYQIVQSLISLASGGVFGRGLGVGSPGFVPVAHSDFVYAAMVEEFGLLGGLAVIALFALLVARGLRVAAGRRDAFGTILSAGLAISFGIQTILIIGGVVRLLPLTGVTLPFVSYGGSSLLTSFLGVGLLLALSNRREPGQAFRQEVRRIQGGMSLAWIALALAVGWWTLYRAPVLTARTDNPRRGLAERFIRRGSILSRSGEVLAESIGERGDYRRVSRESSAASVVGYDSARYAQAGIEAAMDPFLRGEQGHDPLTTWWAHLLLGTPPPGLDIRLTLDVAAQRAAVRGLGTYPGAVVVLDPATGEILAMASYPTFDPNRLDEEWPQLNAREDAPLLNRATQGRYQPGAALAPFLLAWAERESLAAADGPVQAPDEPVTIDGWSLGCAGALTTQDLVTRGQAAAAGCPAPLAGLAELLGAEGLDQALRAFGFDRSPSIRLETAIAGDPLLGASPEDLRRTALGQATLTVTPLQMARALGALASGGTLPALRLVDARSLPQGGWEVLPALDAPLAAVPADVALEILSALQPEPEDPVVVVAHAVTGTGGEVVSWFLGAQVRNGSPVVVVVALEGDRIDDARAAGLGLLREGAW